MSLVTRLTWLAGQILSSVHIGNFSLVTKLRFQLLLRCRDVARIFQRGGHTGSKNIVMVFSPRNIVGCLLKKGLQRGVTGTPGPPLSYTFEMNKAQPFKSGWSVHVGIFSRVTKILVTRIACVFSKFYKGKSGEARCRKPIQRGGSEEAL